ncbi:o-succinylbenzoate synthase [Corynebacterium halotolerans]|uniref:o-succinylbenzoate synthase n=1 Tax=Corynebacterium halotolerans YIM 70093 = DSM 44683 TaxID=1121362 RepID=M1NVG3_9CORY|nr:o-succinylbenzoate synthase [Corynebacterium halotolerans]AGF71470.1 O-succinylbenzoate synthase [Corynebacterium halotolerans YIM 70093 = DSM 44683]
MIPSLDDILDRAHVVSLPMAVRFRGVDTREALLIDGPAGWGEFAPFLEYDAQESAAWLAAGVEAAWTGFPEPLRETVEVNATIPAVDAAQVPEVLARYPGCRTVKVKVAEAGQTLSDDIARVQAVREARPGAVIRVDANRGWTVDQALEAARSLGPLDYLEQPCHSVDELAEVRTRLMRAGLFVRVAADESIRRSDDPYLVAEKRAADVAVVKVAPLGGVRRLLEIARHLRQRHMDVTVASALDTAVGMNAGLAAVAALPKLNDDDEMDVPPAAAGLATQRLFLEDVAEPREIVDGRMSVSPVVPGPARLSTLAAPADRRDWWFERVREAYGYLG